ncbi:hypothetical protein E5288_WYG022408 [Bos mutus]|uniref:Outer dense fiber protein 1 n=1 Tax=Bos mutus TaxID=72004 RepID=A0A6B0S538_9CETA|nr:hypothetical protein [Bos mutus]
MAALSCLLDSVRRDIKKVDRELRQLRCVDELRARCLCDLYMHPYCCCDLHPYPYCLCYSKRSRSCGLCDLYPCCLCDVKLYCLRPSLRSLERKAIRAIEDEKRELAKLRRTTNRILASSCCSSNILGSVNVCGFEPDQVKVRVKDGKVCVSAERENRYDCLGSKKYSYMNICKEFSLPPPWLQLSVIVGSKRICHMDVIMCGIPEGRGDPEGKGDPAEGLAVSEVRAGANCQTNQAGFSGLEFDTTGTSLKFADSHTAPRQEGGAGSWFNPN